MAQVERLSDEEGKTNAVLEELVQIRKVANESMPLDTHMVRAYGQRDALIAIDGHAEKAIELLKKGGGR